MQGEEKLESVNPLATLPSKQGLKQWYWSSNNNMFHLPLATLPSKQGLKHEHYVLVEKSYNPSCYTSIKTRIETESFRFRIFRIVLTSRYTSIKTRIETCHPLF